MDFSRLRYSSRMRCSIVAARVAGVPWPPKVILTPSGWEAYVKWNDKKVIIRRDGKVWVE